MIYIHLIVLYYFVYRDRVIVSPLCFFLIQIPETRTPKEKPGGPKNDRAQSSIPAAFVAVSKYKSDSLEQRAKEQAIALWIDVLVYLLAQLRMKISSS